MFTIDNNPAANFYYRVSPCTVSYSEDEKKLGAYALELVAAGAHLPNPWVFELAKRPDDRADYCLNCSELGHLAVPINFLA